MLICAKEGVKDCNDGERKGGFVEDDVCRKNKDEISISSALLDLVPKRIA